MSREVGVKSTLVTCSVCDPVGQIQLSVPPFQLFYSSPPSLGSPPIPRRVPSPDRSHCPVHLCACGKRRSVPYLRERVGSSAFSLALRVIPGLACRLTKCGIGKT
eukprot:1670139-Pleurochrysis_carterae.AAC.1